MIFDLISVSLIVTIEFHGFFICTFDVNFLFFSMLFRINHHTIPYNLAQATFLFYPYT